MAHHLHLGDFVIDLREMYHLLPCDSVVIVTRTIFLFVLFLKLLQFERWLLLIKTVIEGGVVVDYLKLTIDIKYLIFQRVLINWHSSIILPLS